MTYETCSANEIIEPKEDFCPWGEAPSVKHGAGYVAEKIIDSFTKALYVDAAGGVLFSAILGSSSKFSAGYVITSDTAKYSIRSFVRDATKDSGSPAIEAIIAGSAGGGIKYYATDQNVYVGMLNSIAYEICNNYESCGNDPINSAIFTIAVETIDLTAQIYIGITTGDSKLIISKVSTSINEGLIIGTSVALAAEFIYTQLQNSVYDVMSHAYTRCEEIGTYAFSFIPEHFI